MTIAPLAAQESTPEMSHDYKIVGYYASWAIYGRSYFVTDIPADELTHINYAFAGISADGEITLLDEWADTQYAYPDDPEDAELKGNFRQLQLLKDINPNLQTLISIGGWTQSKRFSDVALTDESRQKFAQSVVDFVVRYGFDGADIDWEYPTGGGDAGNIERPEDKQNFILLLNELRAQLDARGEQDGRHYLLTIAAGAGKTAYEPLDWVQIAAALDWINVMTYDMAGSWSSVTGFNAPLYDSTTNPPEGTSVDTTVQGYLALGVPPEKLVVGVPFYGRGWSTVPATNNGLHQSYEGLPNGTWEAGAFDYGDLATNYVGNSSFERFWDEAAQVPYLYNATAQTMITYDDTESMTLKADYVREHGLGGIMFWELSQDTDDYDLLGVINDVLK